MECLSNPHERRPPRRSSVPAVVCSLLRYIYREWRRPRRSRCTHRWERPSVVVAPSEVMKALRHVHSLLPAASLSGNPPSRILHGSLIQRAITPSIFAHWPTRHYHPLVLDEWGWARSVARRTVSPNRLAHPSIAGHTTLSYVVFGGPRDAGSSAMILLPSVYGGRSSTMCLAAAHHPLASRFAVAFDQSANCCRGPNSTLQHMN